MPTDFDDIFAAASGDASKAPGKPQPEKRTKASKKEAAPAKPDPWSEMQPPEREATIRLNLDIPLSLNDKLAAKAAGLRTSKAELVRKLLEWALE